MKIFKTLTFFIFITILSPMVLHSQENNLTLEDLIPGGKNFNKYRIDLPRGIAWQGEELTYVKGDSMYAISFEESEKPKIYLTLKDIKEGMALNSDAELKSLIYTKWISGESNDLFVMTHDKFYIYNTVTKKIRATYNYSRNMKAHNFSPLYDYFAYTKDNNLYIQSANGGEVAVTQDATKGIVSGSSVHRNEFGIYKGTFWSPRGKLLAFYRMDESMVTDYPLVGISARVAELKNIKYPMAGMKSHHVTIGVYNPKTRATTFLKTGAPKDKYLTNIAWSPDEKSIYVAEINRSQDTCVLKNYNALTGELEATLFTEIHPKYVEPQNPVLFLKNDPTHFIWQSRRDGYNHLYLYNTNGELKKQLTIGKWEVISIIGLDLNGDNLFYTSTEVSPIEKHIFKLDLKSGERTKLSKHEGVHDALLSASGRYISDKYSSQRNPGRIEITDTKSNKTNGHFIAKNPFKNIKLPEITLGTLKANDGETDLYYRLVKPLDFDPKKKYPVIVYVYGGPHSQMVENSWMGRAQGWDIFMAQKGYIIFTIDNRGTSKRGLDFENITHHQLGVIETQDQMTGVEYLKSQPYVDSERIGIHGWSFGGFMTLNLMLRHPETFKVGVAGGSVTDWKYYEIMYGERYMGSPKENPDGYKEANMVDRAGDLKGRLLLIHGDEDPTVVMQHSSQFIKSAIKKGTHPDFFVYPGHGHNMTGHDRVHLHKHITRYFDDFLK